MPKDDFWDGVHDKAMDAKIVGWNAKETNKRLAKVSSGIKSLYLDPSGSFDVTLLSRFKSLRKLVVTAWPGEDFSPLHAMPRLDSLYVSRIKNVRNLDSLRPMDQLRRLTLEGFMLALRRVSVKSFKPLGSLRRLTELSLWCVVPEDKRIDGLLELKPLKHLGLLDDFLTLQQRAQLEVHGHPMDSMVSELKGETCICGSKTSVYLTASPRGRKKFCCPKCDDKRVSEHRTAYAQALDEARRTLAARALARRSQRS
ncbi:MAG: hypothetical protein MUE97_00830 [Phycisphaerales bacterium]|jgi:hypothetical protein|nr:hypothetical protein [Phycisphaerales bacterium]